MVSLVVMRTPESFVANLRLLLFVIAVAALIGPAAAWIVSRPRRQRLVASPVFGLALALAAVVVSYGPTLAVIAAVLIECSCEWWSWLCCLI